MTHLAFDGDSFIVTQNLFSAHSETIILARSENKFIVNSLPVPYFVSNSNGTTIWYIFKISLFFSDLISMPSYCSGFNTNFRLFLNC